jgi:hypothetical protein
VSPAVAMNEGFAATSAVPRRHTRVECSDLTPASRLATEDTGVSAMSLSDARPTTVRGKISRHDLHQDSRAGYISRSRLRQMDLRTGLATRHRTGHDHIE